MAKYTEHYQLHQWEPEDPFLRTDFNEDLAKIDQALAEKGNWKITQGSYIGTGTYGQAAPNSITFDAPPLLVFIGGDGFTTAISNVPAASMMHCGGNVYYSLNLTWAGNTLSWYQENLARLQLNSKDVTYRYLAFIPASA